MKWNLQKVLTRKIIRYIQYNKCATQTGSLSWKSEPPGKHTEAGPETALPIFMHLNDNLHYLRLIYTAEVGGSVKLDFWSAGFWKNENFLL